MYNLLGTKEVCGIKKHHRLLLNYCKYQYRTGQKKTTKSVPLQHRTA